MKSSRIFGTPRPLRTLYSLVVLAGLHTLSPAWAQEDDPTTQARVLYLKGNAAFKKGDDVLAREHYQKSLELRESFDTYCNLGRVEESTDLLSDAYYHLGLCLKLYPPDEELAGPREKYAALHEEVGGQLSPEEMVAIDQKVKEHQVHSQAAAVTDATATSQEIDPEPAPAEPPAVDPGLDPEPPRSRARLPVSLVVGGLGLGSAGAGVYFLVDSEAKRRDAAEQRERMQESDISCPPGEDNHPSCEKLDELYDKADQRRTLGIIFSAAGGALVVGSVLLYVLWPEPKADSAGLPQSGAGWARLGQVLVRPDVQMLSTHGDFSWGVVGRF